MEKKVVCIYGCGEYGIRTYLLLKEKGISITLFVDRDETKHGYVIDNIFCRSYSEILQMDKEKTTLIVAIAHGEGICSEFQDLGFEKVFYYKNIDKLLPTDTQKTIGSVGLSNITKIKELKQSIQELAYQGTMTVVEKRDDMIRMIEGWGIQKENESFTS